MEILILIFQILNNLNQFLIQRASFSTLYELPVSFQSDAGKDLTSIFECFEWLKLYVISLSLEISLLSIDSKKIFSCLSQII